MDQEFIYLEEIANYEDFIVTEIGEVSSSWYTRGVQYAGGFKDVDNEILMDIVDRFLPAALNWIANPKVHYVPKSIGELEHFTKSISKKLERLNKKEEENTSLKLNLNPEFGRGLGKDLLEQTISGYHDILGMAKRSLYVPKKQILYEAVEKIVDLVGDVTSAKRDYSYRYGKKNKNGKKNKTDEQIVAAAICSSLEGKPASIVSPDSDMGRLVKETTKLMCSQNMPHHDYFLANFRENPVRVYFSVSYPYQIVPHLTGEEIKVVPDFHFYGLNGVHLEHTRELVEGYCKEIVDSTNQLNKISQ